MTWFDLLINKLPDNDKVRRVVAKAFGVGIESVNVYESVEEISKCKRTTVAVVVSRFSVGFEGLLSFFLFELRDGEIPPIDDFVQRIADDVGCECMTPNEETVDPYSMLLFSPFASQVEVSIDEGNFDRGRGYSIRDDD